MDGDLLELYSFGIMASGLSDSRGNTVGIDRLHDKMNGMKIWGDKVYGTNSSSHSSSAFYHPSLLKLNDLIVLDVRAVIDIFTGNRDNCY